MSKIVDSIIFTNVNKSNKAFEKHFHDNYFLGITHSGLYKSIRNNNTFNCYTYSTRINNPFELHEGFSTSWDNHSLYPSIELMSDLYFQIYNERKVPIFQTHIIDDINLYFKLIKIFQYISQKEDLVKIETEIIDTLTYLLKKHCQKAKALDNYIDSSKVVKGSIEFINDSLGLDLSLDTLSSNANLSKYHFLRVFKKELGLTPHQYIINQRVEKAKTLITKGYSILDAALEVGFNDQSHFNRNFKRFYDYSPTLLVDNSNFILYNN